MTSHLLGRNSRAIEVLKQAVRIKQDFAEADYNLGITYDSARRYKDAVDCLNGLLR